MERIIYITNLVFISVVLLALVMYVPRLCFWIYGLKIQKKFDKAKNKHKFAIVIPARFESKVIRGLLDSIKKQTYDKELIDTFIIVPDSTDETIEIAKEYEQTEVHILDHKVNCKGQTLDAFFKQQLANDPDKYDAYFIIDADNILEDNFVELMNDAYDTGKYDMVLGGRSNKNYKDGWVSNCSLLTFSLINGLNNKARTALGGNVTISGSGLLIDKHIIKDNDGWPWQSLTEDYELTQVSLVKEYRSCYYEHARVYDEQPKTLKQNKKQIFRWLKGHADVDKVYHKQIFKKMLKKESKNRFILFDYWFGLVPAIMMVISFIIFAICNFAYIFVAMCWGDIAYMASAGYNFMAGVIGILFLFYAYATMGLIADRVNAKMSLKYKITTVLMSPIFFVRYVPLFFKSLCVKNVTWERIDHNVAAKDSAKP